MQPAVNQIAFAQCTGAIQCGAIQWIQPFQFKRLCYLWLRFRFSNRLNYITYILSHHDLAYTLMFAL